MTACLCVGVCTVYEMHACVYSVYGGQKRVLDVLDLGLQMVVSIHVGAGSQPPASARAACAQSIKNNKVSITLGNGDWE